MIWPLSAFTASLQPDVAVDGSKFAKPFCEAAVSGRVGIVWTALVSSSSICTGCLNSRRRKRGLDGTVLCRLRYPEGLGRSTPALTQGKTRRSKYWYSLTDEGLKQAYPVYISVVVLVVAAKQHPGGVLNLNRVFRAFIAAHRLVQAALHN